jgi:ferredoxin
MSAISISENGAEMKGECIGCGVCSAACPNGAFMVKERHDKKIIQEIGSKPTDPEARTFRISCERGDASSDLIVSCLGRLTDVLLLEPFRMGASNIEIIEPSCSECPSAKAASHLNGIIQRTLYLYDMLGIERDRIYKKNIPLQDLIKMPEKPVSRREFFGAIRKNAMGVAAASIPDFENKDKENTEEFREVIHKRPENPKRALLLESLGNFLRKDRTLKTVYVNSNDAILAEVEVTSECTACGVCAALCPTGAITQRQTEDLFSLSFRPYLCTNCHVCVKTCMHKAINIKESALLNLLLEQKEVKLFEGKRKACAACELDFIDKGSDICPLCIDRHKRQMSAVEMLFK